MLHQGSVLEPILYLLYTSNLPEDANTIAATFADDTSILSINETQVEATEKSSTCAWQNTKMDA